MPTALCIPFHAQRPLAQTLSPTPSCPSPEAAPCRSLGFITGHQREDIRNKQKNVCRYLFFTFTSTPATLSLHGAFSRWEHSRDPPNEGRRSRKPFPQRRSPCFSSQTRVSFVSRRHRDGPPPSAPAPVRQWQRQRAAMLPGCTSGPPGPLCRALPAAAPAVRRRLREVSSRGTAGRTVPWRWQAGTKV